MRDSKMQSRPDWASLATDLLEKIAIHLVVVEDFKAFRGVCSSWRGAVMKDKYFNGMFDGKSPLLLLPEQDDGECQLYSLSKKRICGKVALLEEAKGKRYFDVGFGWILAIDYRGGGLRLFKLFSRAKAIQLPDIQSLHEGFVIGWSVLSDDPASDNFALSLLIRVNNTSYWWSWKNGDESWTGKSIWTRSIWTSACSRDKDNFCVLDTCGSIWTWNIATLPTLAVKVDKTILSATCNYLVESSSGDLLLISRHDTSHFNVIKVDVQRGSWEARNDLHGDAIFLSDISPTCVVAADYPGVLKPNCIYFVNDFEEIPDLLGGKDIGIYNIKDRNLEAFNFSGQPRGKSRSPLWVFPTPVKYEPDWAGMVTELLEQIAIRLLVIEDFNAFRDVCTSWRAAVKKDKYFNGIVKGKIPLLLLPEQGDEECPLYSLSERRICGKVALSDEATGKRCFDVGYGWILAIDYQGEDLRLFKSFTRAKAIQPPDIKIPHESFEVRQAVLSDDPTLSNFALSMLAMDKRWNWSYLYTWKNGDSDWTKISPPHCHRLFIFPSIYFYRYITFHALDNTGCLWSVDLFGFQRGSRLRVYKAVDKNLLSATKNHLVMSTAGDLLLIARHDSSYFNVVKIDTRKGSWKVRNDLRGDTIFLSDNSPTSVAAADYPGVVKPNCIYFAYDFKTVPDPLGGKDMGIYNVEGRSLEAFNFSGQPRGKSRSSPLWISPSF